MFPSALHYYCLLLGLSLTGGLLRDETLPKKNLELEFPDAFILGAQKCGTTSLNALFRTHSSFCKEGVKEKHYFSTDNWLDNGSIQRFKNEFVSCKPEELTVDATPSLIGESLVPARIHASYTPESLGKKKFIV